MLSLLFLICFVFLIVFIPSEAMAYIDPGSASLLVQFLFAGLLGAAYVVKKYWRVIKGFIGNLFKKNQQIDTSREQQIDESYKE